MTKLGKWAARMNRNCANDVLYSFRKGKKVYCVMRQGSVDDDCRVTSASCHKDDKFDFNIGRAIAIAKAFNFKIPKQ